jgi:hypothetical protein
MWKKAGCYCRKFPWDYGITSAVDNFENAQYIVKEAFDGITHFDLANNMDRSQAQQRQISVKFWRIIFETYVMKL